jgi:hypothetical protein
MGLHNDWTAPGRRYMTMETAAPMVHTAQASVGQPRGWPAPATREGSLTDRQLHHVTGHDPSAPVVEGVRADFDDCESA